MRFEPPYRTRSPHLPLRKATISRVGTRRAEIRRFGKS
jgi:hypothetical protein